MFSLMKFLPPACRATLPVLYIAATSPSTAVRLTRQQFHRSAILPEIAIATLRGKWPGFAEVRPALAHLALNSKSPAAPTQNARLLLATGALAPDPSTYPGFALFAGAANQSPVCVKWR